MKKYLIAFICILSQNIFGQKIVSGSLEVFYFQNSSVVNVEWDKDIEFSKGISLEEFSKGEFSTEEWNNKVLPTIMRFFVQKINSYTSMHGITFTNNNKNAEYKMIVKPTQLSRKGGGVTVFTIKKLSSNEDIAVIKLNNSGGLFGDISNLLSETYSRAGKSLGQLFEKMMLKPYKVNTIVESNEINYSFDFSSLELSDIKAKEYFVSSGAEINGKTIIVPEKIRSLIDRIFISSANKKMSKSGYELSNQSNSNLEVVISLVEVGKEGKHSIVAKLIDKSNTRILSRLGVKIGDGKLNSFINLFCEQLEETGEEFGEILKDDILKN